MTPAACRRREAVRLQAAQLFTQKIKPPEVARRLRVSRKSAYQWQQMGREGGERALASRGPSGSRCGLSPYCLRKLAGFLEQGPAAHGWDQDQVWTGARVATLIGRKFHVSYSVSRKAAERAKRTFRTRLATGEKAARKRMVMLAAVYDAEPAGHRPHNIISPPGGRSEKRPPRPGPRARAKWLTGSVEHDPTHVIAAAFDQAEARDP